MNKIVTVSTEIDSLSLFCFLMFSNQSIKVKRKAFSSGCFALLIPSWSEYTRAQYDTVNEDFGKKLRIF